MENALILANQLVILFMLALFGFFLQKRGVFTKKGVSQLSNFVIMAVTPFLVFTAFQKELDENLVDGLLMSFLLAIISHIIMVVITPLVFRKNGKKGENVNHSVEQFAVVYSNCGFMGIPLVNSVYGTEGVFYVTAYIAIFNIFVWTHGVFSMTGEANAKSVLKVLRSPAIISVILGLICFAFGIMLPDMLITPMNYIASLNTPLTLIISGAMIAQSNLLEIIKKKRVYLCAAMRLLICPLIIIFVYSFFDTSEIVINTMIIASSAPTAATTIMFANKFGKNALYASEIFAISTLLSAITMPIMMMLSEFINK